MSVEFQSETFGCLKNFTTLRRGQIVYVGHNPDARMTKYMLKGTVTHNWPSQWHTRYKDGYIEIEFEAKRRRFDIANQTMRDKQVFLFRPTPEIDILWRRLTLEHHIQECVDKISPNDMPAAKQLVQELADPKVHDKRLRRYPFPVALRGLSMSQLEDLGELLAVACD